MREEGSYPLEMILYGRGDLMEVLERFIAPASAAWLRIEEGRERFHVFLFSLASRERERENQLNASILLTKTDNI